MTKLIAERIASGFARTVFATSAPGLAGLWGGAADGVGHVPLAPIDGAVECPNRVAGRT
jgi:hypothetical protein